VIFGREVAYTRAPINCGEICDHAVKVLTEEFYCSIASMKLLRVLSLKCCLTLDQFGSKHHRNVAAWPMSFKNISNWLLTFSLTPVANLPTVYMCATSPLNAWAFCVSKPSSGLIGCKYTCHFLNNNRAAKPTDKTALCTTPTLNDRDKVELA